MPVKGLQSIAGWLLLQFLWVSCRVCRSGVKFGEIPDVSLSRYHEWNQLIREGGVLKIDKIKIEWQRIANPVIKRIIAIAEVDVQEIQICR